jgi:hypothetical protein
VHYNANGKGYAQMHAAHPEKAMTHNESFPATIYQDTRFAADNAWAVGTWVWAAWDYLGEAGIGKTAIPAEGTGATIGDQSVMPGWSIARTLHHGFGGFGYPYPYFQANCGDFDLIGQRKPQHHWRSAVNGRSPVELLVLRPAPPGTEQVALWWGYYDELASWTWEVEPERPMTVHVYTPGDSVTIRRGGAEIATRAVTGRPCGRWVVQPSCGSPRMSAISPRIATLSRTRSSRWWTGTARSSPTPRSWLRSRSAARERWPRSATATRTMSTASGSHAGIPGTARHSRSCDRPRDPASSPSPHTRTACARQPCGSG